MTSRLKLGLMFINDQSVWPGRSNTSVRPGWDMVAAPRRDGMGKKRARAEHPGNTCGRHRWLDSPADGGANDDVMTDVTGPLKRTAGPVVSGRDRSVRDPCLGAWRLGTKRVEAEARDSRGRSGGTGPARCWGGGARSGRELEGMEGEEQGREAPAQARVAGRPAEGFVRPPCMHHRLDVVLCACACACACCGVACAGGWRMVWWWTADGGSSCAPSQAGERKRQLSQRLQRFVPRAGQAWAGTSATEPRLPNPGQVGRYLELVQHSTYFHVRNTGQRKRSLAVLLVLSPIQAVGCGRCSPPCLVVSCLALP